MGGPNPIDRRRETLVPTPAAPPGPTRDNFRDGPRTGTTVGTFNGGELRAGQRASHDFGSFEEAAAYARGTGESSVIVAEQGRYAIYRVEEANNGAWLLSSGSQFTRDAAAARPGETALAARGSDPSVIAMVTDDAYLIDLGNGAIQLGGPVTGPFAGRNAAFGPGLGSITDRGQFERQYELALRDTAFFALDQAQRAAETAQARLQGDRFDPADRAAIDRVVPRLQAVDARIAQAERALSDAQWAAAGADLTNPFTYVPGGTLLTTGPLQSPQQQAARAEVARLQQELTQLRNERIAAAQEFPLLLRVDLASFTAMPEAQQVATLRTETQSVLNDIGTTRQNLIDGDFNLWTNDALRATVNAGLGVSGERQQWVQDRATSEARWQAVTSIGTAVLGIGLAVGGAALAPFSGGTSLAGTVAGVAMIGGGIAVGVYDAVTTTQGYLRDQAATNTALDPNAGLLPPDQAGHWGWVVLAWVGVGIDVAQAVGAVSKLARAGQSLDDIVAGATPEARRALQQVADELGVSPQVLQNALRGSNNADFSTRVISSQDFSRAFGSQSAEAVTLVNQLPDGRLQVEIVFREGLSPSERLAALSEETTHLRQITQDPALARHAATLSESNLARWAQMTPTERLGAYRASLEIEIDAQRRLIADASTPPPQAAQARERLGALQGRLDEVNRGLDGGPVATWLAHAEPPRLFADPIFPTNNAAAQAAGLPAPPDGHYYRNLGNGQFELVRFPPGSRNWVDPAVAPAMQLQRGADGSWALRERSTPLSAAERRAEIELRFGEPVHSEAGRALETAMNNLQIGSPFVRAYTRQYSEALAELDRLGGAGSSQRVLQQLVGQSDAAAESILRSALRSETVSAIRALPPADQLAALQRAADALPPANRLRGELFTAYRETVMPPGFTRVQPPVNGVTVSSSGRPADGLLSVADTALGSSGPQRAGRYLVEDKFGGSFNLDQARAYSTAIDGGSGTVRTLDGASHNGIVYVFSSPAEARAALAQIERANLNANIHVAILDAPGSFTWLR